MIPLSRRKDPTDSCQTGFNWYILVSRWFILSPQQDRRFEAVPQPSVPTLHFSLAAWEWWGSMAEQPGPTWATQDCQLSAVPGPSGTDTTCSFILPPFQLHVRHFPTPAAHWGHSFSRSSGYVEAHSPVLRIAIQKWWSLAVLPVILKLLLGKGRKSQKQICKPNSRRAALLSVETVGQKWRETKHASHVTAPLACSSWEVARHCQPFCWGHFYPTLCPPFVL